MTVLALGLDAMDPGLMQRLARSGDMPTMARLLREGAAVRTLAPEGVFVSANWPTLFTANLPDRHGYLCWEQIPGGEYEAKPTDPTMIRGAPIWRRLSEAGRRVAVLDVPHTVAEPVNGVMLCEWGCHDRHLGTASWPRELRDELDARHGAHLGTVESDRWEQFAPCDWIHREGLERTHAETATLIDELHVSLERKRAASLDLLGRGGWDLFMNVMGESHCIGHQFWHLHDRGHYRHDAALAAAVGGDPVRAMYRRLDGVVADHLERLGPGDTAYVTLAHGMTCHHDGTHLLDHVLHRLDWSLDAPDGFGRATRLAGDMARRIPRPARGAALRSLAPVLRRQAGHEPPGPVPPAHERRWFMTPNNTVVGAVRLNLAGRERQGRIDPGDRREVLDWLSERMLERVNVDSGGRVVRRCVVTDDVYRRTPGDGFGDLYVEWDRSAPIERVWSPSVGTVAVPYDLWRQGDHVREGITLAVGPGIRPGRRRTVHPVTDLGATYAAAAGVALDDVDGRPIASILPGGGDEVPPARVPAWARRRPAPQEPDPLAARVAALERGAEVAAARWWLDHADATEELLISVIVPTRNRRAYLAEAIASVLAQSYARWELVVVDDGSSDGTADYLDELSDPRIRTLRTDAVGACGARNAALEAAGGDVVVYLDDDNRYDRHWLAAVASTFAARPDVQAAYGARVVDDIGRVHGLAPAGRPWLQLEAWDPGAIRRANLVDTNVIAHRRGAVRFDESLSFLGDWDLVLRLAETTVPVAIPAVAAYYRTDAPGRISATIPPDDLEREYGVVRAKLAGA